MATKPFTAEEAYQQAKRDNERADKAVEWFRSNFGELTSKQVGEVRIIVLSMLYEQHRREGRL